ncbi:hypothetical protein DDE18_21155 [Nocardioides gansuensis]|uniref:Uncharacterized protein n=1 Tax=Nocardioides gansuensis TaxID=2138300 RepID=A0A2T8F4W3_9ACTN|nr:hypothetical protein DDE18_21155 [Nocardioides gansuensis]
MLFSRARRSGSSCSRRSRTAFSLASRARSRPACACAAVLTGDHHLLDRCRGTSPRLLHKPEATPTAHSSDAQRPTIPTPSPMPMPRTAHPPPRDPITSLAPHAFTDTVVTSARKRTDRVTIGKAQPHAAHHRFNRW